MRWQLLGGGQEKDERALDTALFKTHQLKPHFIQVVNELMDEVEGIYTNIANQALDHIHSK